MYKTQPLRTKVRHENVLQSPEETRRSVEKDGMLYDITVLSKRDDPCAA